MFPYIKFLKYWKPNFLLGFRRKEIILTLRQVSADSISRQNFCDVFHRTMEWWKGCKLPAENLIRLFFLIKLKENYCIHINGGVYIFIWLFVYFAKLNCVLLFAIFISVVVYVFIKIYNETRETNISDFYSFPLKARHHLPDFHIAKVFWLHILNSIVQTLDKKKIRKKTCHLKIICIFLIRFSFDSQIKHFHFERIACVLSCETIRREPVW